MMKRIRMRDSHDLKSVQRLIDQIFLLTEDIHALNKLSVGELDLIESRFQTAAATLRGYRNSRLAIHRIPPEILSEIFRLTQPHLPSFFSSTADNFHDLTGTRRWLDLLGVCRRWRGIVATSPKLWSSVIHQSDIERYLKRSLSAPFSVNLLPAAPQELKISTHDSLAVHRRRLAELHFNISDNPAYLTHRFLTRSAPELFSLSVYSLSPVASTALPPLFAGQMPRLRQLALAHFVSWPTGYFHNLTHLALCDQPYHARLSTSMFLDFLEHSPLLEVMILADAGPIKEDALDHPPVTAGRMISLTALKELNLGIMFPAFAVARLLSHLSIPSNTDIYIISMAQLLRLDEGLASFLPSDISHLQNLANIEECVVSRTNGTDHPSAALSPHHFSIANSTLQVHTSFSPTQFSPFYDRYPLINVRKLSIHDSSNLFDSIDHLSAEHWRGFFAHTPALETLNIFRSAGSTPVTSEILTALESDTEKSFLCPLLRFLHIDEEYSMPTLRLFTILKERAEQGKRLRRLIVSFTDLAPLGAASPVNPYLSAFTIEDANMLESHVEEMIFLPHETAVDRIYHPEFGTDYVRMFKRLNHFRLTPNT
ncbi:hypothetical protein C8J56DRAFT_837411 [Mycena floridula]|nr:hypothetical protein C8J56DRAFT_837411 [Mycena floridula]